MKTKLFNLIVFALLSLTACDQKKTDEAKESQETKEIKEEPDYEAFDEKVEIVRSFLKAHEEENLEAQRGLLADTLKWSPPYYNDNKWLGKSDYITVLQDYHENYENIKFEEGIKLDANPLPGMWSGSVFPKDEATATPDAIRVYGTWKAKHTPSGKDVGVKWFALCWINDDGKISQVSEFFDVHGLAVQIEDKK